jgi:hypothetical protein
MTVINSCSLPRDAGAPDLCGAGGGSALDEALSVIMDIGDPTRTGRVSSHRICAILPSAHQRGAHRGTTMLELQTFA